ncbi:bifunctional [glutamine synthetase] adenylyltransferase/[glutamine synthetase]-adenylyl-L-tyrosine phosphorylase [Brachybacterium huguangmaarense]
MAPDLTRARLARAGFGRTERAQRFLADPALEGLTEEGAEAIGATADADEALLALLRVAEAARAAGSDVAPGIDMSALLGGVGGSGTPGARLVVLLGASVALGDFLTRHPEHLADLDDGAALEVPAADVRAELLRAVGADPDAEIPVSDLEAREARDALRVAYHARLLRIAVADLSAPDPVAIQPDVSHALADLADAALDAALAVGRAGVEGHERVRLAVIAMGKTGARELNYISDVDVVFVAEGRGPREDGTGAVGEDEVIATSSALARELARVCSDRTGEGSLWQVDANLRPEGKDGPLTRTLDSCRRYYDTWAKSWEFQALLKARAAAGDRELGRAFTDMVDPLVWQASTREGFVEDSRAMRRRVIDHIPRGEVERNLKLGPGGLRDVEFTVQMLQMVHGRQDPSIHARGTLPALVALRDGGYIGREHAAELDGDYRFLRTVEHRLQLHRMRRTHVLPTSEADVRRLARSLGLAPEEFASRYERVRKRVRRLHEEIYYRPLLVTSSRLSDGEVALTPEAAAERLAGIGYRDPKRALAHIEALTEGISRRAAIQRQLLPAMLEWFADGVDPDRGLLAFRRLSELIGSAHWYMGLLRDSGVAAQRLTRVLADSRFAGEQLEAIPEAVRWLARDAELRPLTEAELLDEFAAVIRRVDTLEDATDVLRRTRRRELLRVALAHLVRLVTPEEVARALTDIAEAVLRAGVRVAAKAVLVELTDDDAHAASEISSDQALSRLGIDFSVIAMGSFGAREMGYSSDADVQFVVADAGAGERTGELGVKVAATLQRILNAPSAGADMKVSADLRPEGRNGVLARTVESWTDYCAKSAETWEKQALVRARAITGSEELVGRITAVMDSHRYPEGGLTARGRREITTMKARVESGRLPRGADPSRHLKLGRGSMTDVEWVVQKLVMDAASEHAELRGVTGTLEGLRLLVDADRLTLAQADDLGEAWSLAWQLRRALFLWKGRENAILPLDRTELFAAARVVEGESGTAAGIEERYLRVTRHARQIVEQILFEDDTARA